MHDDPATPPVSASTRLIWIALLTTASAVFSLALACATPFAALATLAARTLDRRDAVGLIGLAWIANQAVGFGLHGYPHTVSTYGWGVAIGAAALAALVAVMRMPRLPTGGPVASALLGLAAAFCALFVSNAAVSAFDSRWTGSFTAGPSHMEQVDACDASKPCPVTVWPVGAHLSFTIDRDRIGGAREVR